MSSQKEKAKATEIEDIVNPDPEEVSGSGSEREVTVQDESISSTSHKKKKKKKKKFLLGGGKDEIPQNVVDHVLDKVKEDGTITGPDLNAENVREALEQLKIMEVAKGKVGLGGANKKDIGEHKV